MWRTDSHLESTVIADGIPMSMVSPERIGNAVLHHDRAQHRIVGIFLGTAIGCGIRMPLFGASCVSGVVLP